MDFAALRDQTIQSTSDFLNIEAALGITFVGLAKQYKETGNAVRYEISKRNAMAALAAIDHFKERLPNDLRMDIEARRSELARLISVLMRTVVPRESGPCE
jgi:hypothetical protein